MTHSSTSTHDHVFAQAMAQCQAMLCCICGGGSAVGYKVAPSHTNFLFFDSREPASALAERLLARGVIVKAWGDPGFQRYIRVTVGSRADNEQFLTALVAVAGV